MKISSIRDQLDGTVDSQPHGASTTFIGTKLTHIEPTTAADITKVIKKLSNASCGLDCIPTKLLNGNMLDTLAPIISLMVNLSSDTGILPDSLKEGLVHPLLKKILLDTSKNYRPISNLAFVLKVMKKVAAVQLYKHMDINDLEIFQSAYKELHSTETALVRGATNENG